MGVEASKAADANGAGGQPAKPKGVLEAFDCSSMRREHAPAHGPVNRDRIPATDENPAQTTEPRGDVTVRLASRLALERMQFISKGGCTSSLEGAAKGS